MGEASKANIKLIQIPIPEELARCFLCGERLHENGVWFYDQPLIAKSSMFLFACLQHVEDAKNMIEGMEGFVSIKRNDFKLPGSDEEVKTE